MIGKDEAPHPYSSDMTDPNPKRETHIPRCNPGECALCDTAGEPTNEIGYYMGRVSALRKHLLEVLERNLQQAKRIQELDDQIIAQKDYINSLHAQLEQAHRRLAKIASVIRDPRH